MTQRSFVPPIPDQACDSHIHIYADVGAGHVPPGMEAASVAGYRRVRQGLGTTRAVVVTPSAHGLDNAPTMAAIAALANDGAQVRGVAVIAPDAGQVELDCLHAGGIRGVRANFVQAGATARQDLAGLAARIADRGWHLQLNLLPAMLSELEPILLTLPVPVVLDHMARIDNVASAACNTLRRMLATGRVWVKLSGAYLIEAGDPLRRPAVSALSRLLIADAPERLVWGSNWPHPTCEKLGLDRPNDADLLAQLSDWCAGESVRQRILVGNPQHLYGFPARQFSCASPNSHSLFPGLSKHDC